MKVLFYSFIMTLFSCQTVVFLAVGIKAPKDFTDKELLDWAQKNHIDSDRYFSLDTGFHLFVSSLGSDTVQQQYLFYQPIQIYCFAEDGKLLSYSSNCDYGGIRNTDWNNFGTFDTFPVTNRLDTSILNKIKFSAFSRYLRPLVENATIPSGELLVLFVGKTLYKKSKSLIRMVQEKYPEGTVIYVNTDRFQNSIWWEQ